MPNSLKSLLEAIRDNRGLNTIRKIAAEVESELSRAPIAEGGGDGEYSQGVMGDGAAILHTGIRMTIDEIVASLNRNAAIESLSRQGGEPAYDRDLIAKMLADYAYPDPLSPRHYATDAIRKQAELLIAADNRDAAGVRTVRRASEAGDWVLVPREPTDAMIAASDDISCRSEGREHWQAFLASAPQRKEAD